jgi:hypothetical protein
MFTFDSISGPFLFGKDMPTILKTVGMYLGKWRNKNPRFKNIKWSTKPVKALGYFMDMQLT